MFIKIIKEAKKLNIYIEREITLYRKYVALNATKN